MHDRINLRLLCLKIYHCSLLPLQTALSRYTSICYDTLRLYYVHQLENLFLNLDVFKPFQAYARLQYPYVPSHQRTRK